MKKKAKAVHVPRIETERLVLRQLEYYKGAYHDDVVYSMLREEWANGKRFIPKPARRGRE